MRSKSFGGLLALTLLSGPMAAPAATLHVDGNGILTGASGVNVGGTLYDVRLADGSCVSLFTDCDDAAQDFAFTSSSAASLAAQALLDQVFIDAIHGQFDSQPDLTHGCGLPGFCSTYTPYATTEGVVAIVSAENFFSGIDSVIEIPIPSAFDTAPLSSTTFAVWSAATVPAPGTLGLLVLGLIGGAVTRRPRVAR